MKAQSGVSACLSHRAPEGVQGGVQDSESCSLENGLSRPNTCVRSVSGTSWSGNRGRRSLAVVWSRPVVVCGRQDPSQRTRAAAKRFTLSIISTNPLSSSQRAARFCLIITRANGTSDTPNTKKAVLLPPLFTDDSGGWFNFLVLAHKNALSFCLTSLPSRFRGGGEEESQVTESHRPAMSLCPGCGNYSILSHRAGQAVAE